MTVQTPEGERVIEADHVVLDDGETIPGAFITGAAGARPHPWIHRTELPLEDGFISYESAEGESVPETLEQYAKDVSAFMYWMADPHLAERKAIGFRALIVLIVLAGLMYMVKRRIWAKAH